MAVRRIDTTLYEKEKSMEKLHLTMAMGPYDRTMALRLGDVQPEGIKLNYLTLEPEEAFWRMVHYGEFHVSEMSFGTYVSRWAQGKRDLIAIPVFPSRSFRHASVYLNIESGIDTPKDLEGKRIGLPGYAHSAGIWIRGALRDYYGVDIESIHWFQAGLEEPGREDKVQITLPSQVSFRNVRDRVLSAMLETGDLDAVCSARAPSCFVRRSPKIKRLWPDYKKEEVEYYRRSRIFPIMHTVVIRRDIHEEHPWVAQSLFKALEEAKQRCLQQMGITAALRYSLPWLIPAVEEQEEVFGPDPFPYGLEANRFTIETFMSYLKDMYLIEKVFDPAEMFAPSTVRPSRI
ncbi:MAG: ABC transporter substrate-binding protein [Chloroflexi bacterium]|nr:ABC transporter substrate-binding protein [Chloroflexota bacterium]